MENHPSDVPYVAHPLVATHRYYAIERVIYGKPFDEAIREQIDVARAERVFVIAAPQATNTEPFARLLKALGARHCGTFSDIPPHVPFASVRAATRQAQQSDADLLVTLGGGSAIDLSKAVSLCLKKKVNDWNGLAQYSDLSSFDPSQRYASDPGWIRSIAIPTTLSAAELTWFTGVTDTELGMKRVLGHPMLVPQTVIYDAALTLNVPLPLFLASGVKAVDHAAESIASLGHQPFSDAVSIHALGMLATALPAVSRSPDDLNARLQCQVAAWLSISGGASGVGVGASHAIGHMLGSHFSMPHGITSCVMLPAVMRWNKSVNAERQSIVSAAMGRPGRDAGDVIEELIRALGLPSRLRDAQVSAESLPEIARKTMEDAVLTRNPRRINDAGDVLEILQMAY